MCYHRIDVTHVDESDMKLKTVPILAKERLVITVASKGRFEGIVQTYPSVTFVKRRGTLSIQTKRRGGKLERQNYVMSGHPPANPDKRGTNARRSRQSRQMSRPKSIIILEINVDRRRSARNFMFQTARAESRTNNCKQAK